MLVSYQWLRELISLPEPFETILPKLTSAGIAVEQVRPLGISLDKVVVAELLTVEKHPQADRLSLTQVSTGRETFQVVCGAKNIAPGQKVPLAMVGAVLPGNFEIKPAKIRGVESFGMLCSAKELGLAEDAEGILILPSDSPLGEPFAPLMGLPDTLFELEITPNRADLLSHFGLARELSTLLDRPARVPDSQKGLESAAPSSSLAKVTVESGELCPLYSCVILQGIKVGPSPVWLSRRLERLGHRSINNVVDVTNFVLHESGQPLHAFDLNRIEGKEIRVRKAVQGEKIPLLDKTTRELEAGMLVIADKEKPIALAGVMGGANSEVTDQTTDILLEAALFQPSSVRKTARRLALSTDSSYRFERGVDPKGVKAALDRAASLILQTAGGSRAKGVLSVESPLPAAPPILFRPARARALLGLDAPDEEQSALLIKLGVSVKAASKQGTLEAIPPSHRLDLTGEIDLIEEVARLCGYDRVPLTPPRVTAAFTSVENPVPFEEETRFIFHQAGLHEAVNGSFLAENFADQLNLGADHPYRRFVAVQNPIADDQKVLRPSLLPSLLSNVQLNLSHQRESAYLYELNKVFQTAENPEAFERFQAAAVLAGSAFGSGWHTAARKTDFYDLKGLAENLISRCRLKETRWIYGKGPMPYFAAQSFQVETQKGQVFLWGGALHPRVLKNLNISAPCFALELDFTGLSGAAVNPPAFSALPKFPEAWRDIALVVPDGVTSDEVLTAIGSQNTPALKKTTLFDLYRGPNVPAGTRSLAFRLRFQDTERTLTDAEIAGQVARILDHLKTRYSIVIR
jgi:phenylalanyl-tRNA synthetase beta chain